MKLYLLIVCCGILIVLGYLNVSSEMEKMEQCTAMGGTWFSRPQGCAIPLKT